MLPPTVAADLSGRDLAALTSAEAAEVAGSIVLVPVGAVEQHGPHLPLGTDSWLAHRVALGAAARCTDVLVGEALPIGCSAHHRSFPGTLSLRPATFIAMITEVAHCLATDGFIPVFVNGHGGNRAPLGAALQELLADGVEAWGLSYFELIRTQLEEGFPDPTAIGHACAMETSLSQALWSELVHADRIPEHSGTGRYPDASLFSGDPVTRHVRFEQLSPNGVVGDPAAASAQTGQDLLESAVTELAAVCDRIRRTAAASRRVGGSA